MHNAHTSLNLGKIRQFIIHVLFIALVSACAKKIEPGYTALVEIPFDRIRIADDFWSPRIRQIQDTTVFDLLKVAEELGKIDNLRVLAGEKEGKIKLFVAPDSDLWKIIEGAVTRWHGNGMPSSKAGLIH
jgi:hypothetical protein